MRPRVDRGAVPAREPLVAPRAGRLLLSAAELQRSVGTYVLEVVPVAK